MEAVAKTTGVRISTRKVRLVADAIRNMPVAKAMQILLTNKKHGASILVKILQSAVANALQKGNVDEAALYIKTLEVDGGPILRRMHIGSRSHVRMYTKRSTHVTVIVSDTKTMKKNITKQLTKTEEIKKEEGKVVKKMQDKKEENK